jgi:hypothetical protein
MPGCEQLRARDPVGGGRSHTGYPHAGSTEAARPRRVAWFSTSISTPIHIHVNNLGASPVLRGHLGRRTIPVRSAAGTAPVRSVPMSAHPARPAHAPAALRCSSAPGGTGTDHIATFPQHVAAWVSLRFLGPGGSVRRVRDPTGRGGALLVRGHHGRRPGDRAGGRARGDGRADGRHRAAWLWTGPLCPRERRPCRLPRPDGAQAGRRAPYSPGSSSWAVTPPASVTPAACNQASSRSTP